MPLRIKPKGLSPDGTPQYRLSRASKNSADTSNVVGPDSLVAKQQLCQASFDSIEPFVPEGLEMDPIQRPVSCRVPARQSARLAYIRTGHTEDIPPAVPSAPPEYRHSFPPNAANDDTRGSSHDIPTFRRHSTSSLTDLPPYVSSEWPRHTVRPIASGKSSIQANKKTQAADHHAADSLIHLNTSWRSLLRGSKPEPNSDLEQQNDPDGRWLVDDPIPRDRRFWLKYSMHVLIILAAVGVVIGSTIYVTHKNNTPRE